MENEKKFLNKKRFTLILWIISMLFLGSFLVYWYLTWSPQYYYFPNNYVENEGKINLWVFAAGKYNAIDYYKWWYGIYVNRTWDDRKRRLTSLEIRNPALHGPWVEIWGDTPANTWKACTAPNTPEGCWSVYYIFKWKWENGSNYESKVVYYDKNSTYSNINTWYVNVIDKIKENAWNLNTRERETLSELILHSSEDRLLVEVRFWDDIENGERTISSYKDVSKKFNFRVDKRESSYIWIASSEKNLFNPTNWSVKPEDLKKINFATIHLWPNANPNFSYFWRVTKELWHLNLITIDIDNIDYDSKSQPQMQTYLEVWLLDVHNWETRPVDKNWVLTNQPIARISPYKNGNSTYPTTNEAFTDWLEWPSGTFQCNVSIGSPSFRQCYDNQTKWITQHNITFTPVSHNRVIRIDVKNAQRSWVAGNAFALASDIDIWNMDQDDIIDTVPEEDDDEWNDDDVPWWTWSWIIIDWLKGTTYVEINPAEELDFRDHGKVTKKDYTHTYKMELCNTSTGILNNVMTKLHIPNKTTLIWKNTPADINTSSLMLSWSNLDNPIDNSKKLDINIFDTEISLWNLDVDECQFLTYQVNLNDSVENGDEFTVQNEFKYWTWSYTLTNQVKNTINLNQIVSISLESNPISGSDVYNNDMIEYRVTVNNDGDTKIWPGKVNCPRMLDTTTTFCKVWECRSEYLFDEILPWELLSFSYIVEVRDRDIVPNDTILYEQCKLDDSIDSNEVDHTVKSLDVDVIWGWNFSLYLNSRPKLLNSPDWNPRPDGYDRSPIQYTYRYTGSDLQPMYPQTSDPWTYVLSRWWCWPMTLPYKPNSYTFNANSTSTSPMNYLNLSSNNLNFSLNTTLPNDIPKTRLHAGTLTPTHYVPWNELNNRYKSWWDKVLPITATEHRALVNGTNGRINSNITGTMRLDRWQYRAYSTSTCSYICWCSLMWCWSCSVSYPLYRWERVNNQDIPFNASAFRNVTVWWSVAWIKTEWSHVHTNDKLSWDGSQSNIYDLWENWYNNVSSAPKLYSPPGASHWDYVVSSNNSSSTLSSSKWRYIYDKNVKMWHWYVYDRENNSRDFYYDLIESQKFGKVVKIGLSNPIRNFNMDLNHVYYYPGNLTINNPSGTSVFSWFKGTIVVEGDLYINSNMKYSTETKNRVEDLVYLWIIVKWDVYIDPRVTETIWSWYVEWSIHTWDAVETLKHLWSWTASNINFQRKAPEFYERDVNEPSEWIVFNDQVYITTPPGFAQLDDWVWAYNFNINQFTWDAVDY